MKITIEPDLSTSVEYFFAYPPKSFKNQSQATKILKIPLQQRDYDWGNKDEEGNSIEGLLEDMDYHINESTDNYFAGTVLLENQNSDTLKLIDGQQRITTLFLLNFVGYLISRYRIEKIPSYPNPIHYALQFKERFDTFLKFEKRIFLTNLNDSIDNLISQTGANESNQELLKRIGRSKNAETDYWINVNIRLQFDDIDINASIVETIKKTNLIEQNSKFEFKTNKGLYANGITIILDYLIETNQQGPNSNDEYLKELIERVEKYLQVCGLASIISEDENDSFRLFEILNDRGQDLSALDLIKNIILEKCKQKSIKINDFTKDWKKIKDNVRKSFTKGKADSIFVENIIRSEGCTLKNKEISYLSNKTTKEKRNIVFMNENIDNFFQRLLASSLILKELNENTGVQKSTRTTPFSRNVMTAFQYATFMKMINYNWGSQILLCSNINYLKSSKYKNSLNSGSNTDWKNKNSNLIVTDLNHFTRFLGDVTLKLGLLGIVNGLATKDLPSTSKEIANLIISNIEKNPSDFNSPQKIRALINQITSLLNGTIFTDANINQFESRLSSTFTASTNQKKNIVKILLYFIYNQGGVVHNLSYPELEHLESQNPTVGSSPYYSNADRTEIINRLGNFALIEKEINIVDFSNKPLIEKIRLATTDPALTSIALFKNDLFLNLDYNNSKTNSSVYGSMPLIKKATSTQTLNDDSFDFNGVPQPYFFNERSKFLARLAKKIVCNTTNFLDGSGKY
ncbi:MAG: DUF262 domain-containing protein [Bacteroidetes bacterium]|nr:DUF262 domain-containing protein [Bacteroidota bacterium]